MASGQIRKVVCTAAICAALGLDAATTWQVKQSTGNDALLLARMKAMNSSVWNLTKERETLNA